MNSPSGPSHLKRIIVFFTYKARKIAIVMNKRKKESKTRHPNFTSNYLFPPLLKFYLTLAIKTQFSQEIFRQETKKGKKNQKVAKSVISSLNCELPYSWERKRTLTRENFLPHSTLGFCPKCFMMNIMFGMLSKQNLGGEKSEKRSLVEFWNIYNIFWIQFWVELTETKLGETFSKLPSKVMFLTFSLEKTWKIFML